MEIDVSKLSTQPQIKTDRLFVTVYLAAQPEKPSFKGFAHSLTSQDLKGKFDILPMHENFVANITSFVEILSEGGEKITYKIKDGVIEVAGNVVRVFIKT